MAVEDVCILIGHVQVRKKRIHRRIYITKCIIRFNFLIYLRLHFSSVKWVIPLTSMSDYYDNELWYSKLHNFCITVPLNKPTITFCFIFTSKPSTSLKSHLKYTLDVLNLWGNQKIFNYYCDNFLLWIKLPEFITHAIYIYMCVCSNM